MKRRKYDKHRHLTRKNENNLNLIGNYEIKQNEKLK